MCGPVQPPLLVYVGEDPFCFWFVFCLSAQEQHPFLTPGGKDPLGGGGGSSAPPVKNRSNGPDDIVIGLSSSFI